MRFCDVRVLARPPDGLGAQTACLSAGGAGDPEAVPGGGAVADGDGRGAEAQASRLPRSLVAGLLVKNVGSLGLRERPAGLPGGVTRRGVVEVVRGKGHGARRG